MEIIKLFDGVYEISPALEPFKLEYRQDFFSKIESRKINLRKFLYSMGFTDIESQGWGPSSSDDDNTGQENYHIDGVFDHYPNLDYMLLCIFSNEIKQGTYLKLCDQKIKFLTKPWTPYLIRGNIPHRGKPIKFKIRACLRFYFNSLGKLS